MNGPGRIPLSKLEKAKRKAARDYRKLIEKRNLTYDDIFEKRVGNKSMGRKPVSKAEQIKRAKDEFLISLFEHRAEAREDSTSLPGIRSLLREYITYRANDSAGRKGSDRVIALMKYISKEKGKLNKSQEESCPMETYNGVGRKPMSRDEKLIHYKEKIHEAEVEMNELIDAASQSQNIYYKLRQERIEVRRLKSILSSNPSDENIAQEFKNHKENVKELEKEYNNQLVVESEQAESNMAETLSSLTTSLPNSDSENESAILHGGRPIVLTNMSKHDELKLLKEKQSNIDKEIKVLEDLEEVLKAKALLCKQSRELQQSIDIKQRQLVK